MDGLIGDPPGGRFVVPSEQATAIRGPGGTAPLGDLGAPRIDDRLGKLARGSGWYTTGERVRGEWSRTPAEGAIRYETMTNTSTCCRRVAVRSAKEGEARVVSHDVHLLVAGTLGCVKLLLLLRAEAARLPERTVIHVETTDPVAPIDLPAWCRLTGHAFLGTVPGTNRPTYAVQVTARPVATQPDAPWRVAR